MYFESSDRGATRLFVSVFGAILFWTTRLDRARLLKFAQLPLDEPAPVADADQPGTHPSVKGLAK